MADLSALWYVGSPDGLHFLQENNPGNSCSRNCICRIVYQQQEKKRENILLITIQILLDYPEEIQNAHQRGRS